MGWSAIEEEEEHVLPLYEYNSFKQTIIGQIHMGWYCKRRVI
jgi:hypothetical protein